MVKVEVTPAQGGEESLILQECITDGYVDVSIGDARTRVKTSELKRALESVDK